MAGDELTERKARIAELRQLKGSDFVLRDKMELAQGDVEAWNDAITAAGLDFDALSKNVAKLRRLAVEAAYNGNWYAKAPELTGDDFKLIPPPLVAIIGDAALSYYNELVAPDESFT